MKISGVTLDLISDPNMYLFVENGIRGGISYISNRYSKANNKYLETYDSTEPSKYIVDLDSNNLYGGAMCELLPVGDYRWEKDIKNYDYKTINGARGCILEVDIDYPAHLHDLHKDYPLCPESMIIRFYAYTTSENAENYVENER